MFDAASNTERYIENRSYLADPASIDDSAVRAGRNVIEHQLVGAFLAIAIGQLDDLADNPVIAELNAFDDFAVANVKAGDYATRRNGLSSCALILPSSRARPVIAALAPRSASLRRSSACLTPPEACKLILG